MGWNHQLVKISLEYVTSNEFFQLEEHFQQPVAF